MAMSVAAAASSCPSSSGNRIFRRSQTVVANKCCLRRPATNNLPAFPTLVPPSPRLFFSPVFSGKANRRRIGVLLSGDGIGEVQQRKVSGELSWDDFLSTVEILCVLPPSIFSLGCVVSWVFPGASKVFLTSLGNKFFACQFVLLVSAVAIGGLIRRRQWRRICWENGGNSSVDLIARIEKLEQDTRSSATVVRVLSRQLEKLGTRFRVTRKALKDPIAEAAALAKKNSEVTRALAMQEDILEKELVEIQNVLLLMQEQQEKQLELIVAIGKAGRLIESNLGSDEEQCSTGESIPVSGKELNELEIQAAGDGNRT